MTGLGEAFGMAWALVAGFDPALARIFLPAGRPLTCTVEEALDILQDFESGLGATIGAP